MATKRRAATKKPIPAAKPVDPFKRFHIVVALAPTFARAYLEGKIGLEHKDVAEALVDLADAIARKL